MSKNIIIFGLLLISTHGKAQQILTAGLPFIANYRSSFDGHVINHDIRTPVVQIQSASLIQPAVQVLNTFPNFARLATPIPIGPQTINTINPVVQNQPTLQSNDEKNDSIEVEAAERSVEIESKSARLEQPKQEENQNNNQRSSDVPNPVLLGAQFLARNNLKSVPTPVPNGFVFHSRVVTDEGLPMDNVQTQIRDQRPTLQRVRLSKIQRFPVQENAEDKQMEERVNEESQKNAGEKGGSPQTVRPNIYSRLITF